MLNRCEYAFYMRYVEGIKTRPGGALVFGRADDQTKNDVYENKLSTRETREAGYCREKFAAEFETAIEAENNEIEWGKDDRGKLKDTGLNLIAHWRDQLAVCVTPVKVQHEFHVPIPYFVRSTQEAFEFDFMGYMDLVEEISPNGSPNPHRVITDNKTSGKRWAKSKAPSSTQGIGYAVAAEKDPELQMLGVDPGEVHFHVAVKTATPVLQGEVCHTSPEDRVGFVKQLSKAHKKINDNLRTGNWMPNGRDHFLCSKKWCGYWKECQAEHGGYIKE